MVFGRAFTPILAAFLFIGLGLSLFEVEAVKLLGGTSYLAAVPVVAPVILAGFFQSCRRAMDAAFYIHHQTKQKLAITLAATVLIVILYALWIPAYGSMGAAPATLAGFAFLAVATWWVTQRIFPVVYEWRRLGTILALATAFSRWASLAVAGDVLVGAGQGGRVAGLAGGAVAARVDLRGRATPGNGVRGAGRWEMSRWRPASWRRRPSWWRRRRETERQSLLNAGALRAERP